MSRGLWVVVIVAVIAGLAAVALPLLGLAIFFRHDIGACLFGPGEPASGTRLVYEVPSRAEGSAADIEQIRRVLVKRIDPNGRQGCVVRPADGRIEIQVPGRGPGHAAEVERVKRLVAREGVLEFRIVADKVKDADKVNFERLIDLKRAGRPPDTPQFRWCTLKRGWEWHEQGMLDAWNFVYVVDKESQTVEGLVDVSDGQDVTGADLARVAASSLDGEAIVEFSLKAEAGARFARLTRREAWNRHLAIILDGVVESAPVLRTTLSTSGIIEGYQNIRERDDIVSILNSGQLGIRLGEPVAEEHFEPVPGR